MPLWAGTWSIGRTHDTQRSNACKGWDVRNIPKLSKSWGSNWWGSGPVGPAPNFNLFGPALLEHRAKHRADPRVRAFCDNSFFQSLANPHTGPRLALAFYGLIMKLQRKCTCQVCPSQFQSLQKLTTRSTRSPSLTSSPLHSSDNPRKDDCHLKVSC